MRGKKLRSCEQREEAGWAERKEWRVNTRDHVSVSCLTVLLWGWEQQDCWEVENKGKGGCPESNSPRGNSTDLGRAPGDSPLLKSLVELSTANRQGQHGGPGYCTSLSALTSFSGGKL